MVSKTTMKIPKVLIGTIASGFRISRFIANDGRRRGDVAISLLLQEFGAAARTRTHLRGLSSLSMLNDIAIHSLDIRRPLGKEQSVPEHRLVRVADSLWSDQFLPRRKLCTGLRVEAADVDWHAGDGPVVSGPAKDPILAMSGRLEGLESIRGQGMTDVFVRARSL